MRVVDQGAEEIAEALGSLDVDWMDATAGNVIAKLTAFGVKEAYGRADVAALLDDHFDEGLLCCRLFLGLSKDQSEALLREALGKGGIGVTRYQTDRAAFLAALEGFGLLDAMATTVNRKLVWSDVLVERLRSGRGSAISG